MRKDCIPILDKKEEVKRQAIVCVGSSILWILAQFVTLFAMGLLQAWPIIFTSLGLIWSPWVIYAFGIKKEVKPNE